MARYLGMTQDASRALLRVHERFPMFVTPYYLSLARERSAGDPILRQCVPSLAELDDQAGEDPDPLAEARDTRVPGVIHRYPDRVLVLAGSRCAVHCRHCMRKRLWRRPAVASSPVDPGGAVTYVANDSSIREVIVSGGDPLLLPQQDLDTLLGRLRRVPHVETIRIGSRLPVVLPQRLTQGFCDRIGQHGPVWLATHFNHPWEVTPEAASACERLIRAGIPVVNQTVLLRQVNDDVQTMAALCRALIRARVKPYYLFHGDPVSGTMHFRTGLQKGLAVMAALERSVSGLALPAFAFDLPGGEGKVRLHPCAFCGTAPDGAPLFLGREGRACPYPQTASQD